MSTIASRIPRVSARLRTTLSKQSRRIMFSAIRSTDLLFSCFLCRRSGLGMLLPMYILTMVELDAKWGVLVCGELLAGHAGL